MTLGAVDDYYHLIRKRERRQFEEFLRQIPEKRQFGNMLYLQGISGVGKTTLLDQFAKIAKGMNFEWILVNGKDSMYSEGLFVQQLFQTLGKDDKYHDSPVIDSLQRAASIINGIVKNKSVVFAIDGYEYILSQDVFIRLHLISKLDPRVRIVITSTQMLPSHWLTDLHPQWRITFKEVQPFSYQEVLNLLSSHHLDVNTCNTIWKITRGHALSIALALSMIQSNAYVSLEHVHDGVIDEMSRYWYECIPDSKLKDLVTVSSLLFQFNQEILEYVLQKEIPSSLFHQLTSLSFCRPSKKGWYIHDLVREAVYTNFQRRLPNLYNEYIKRCAFYYYHRLKDSFKKQQDGLVEKFYHFYFFTGVPYVQDLYFKGKVQSTNYFEWMNPSMYQEVLDYIQRRKQSVTLSAEQIELDGMTEEQHLTIICNEFELIRPQELLEFGGDSVRLLRNEDREMIGLSIVLPIHKYIDYLREQPVIGHYLHYASKSESDLKQGSNWFLRMFDSIVPMTDEIVRSDILKGILSYIGPNRFLVTSIAYPGLGMVLESLGFQRIPDLIHYDFGENFPASTFVLDLRGENFYSFLDNKMEQAGYALPRSHKFSFTRREQEVANLLLCCKTNEEIADDLHISIVTVKKHIGNIFQKTGVKNRAQFIHLMLQS
ncbi:LuxR C-terminal-related transcriptional regulator [Lederbergia citri]|uniref:Helix-turn-helix domain-containing protein n=1 Tax=Lederbergia citri TaxID=2833580 RepID=A0A942THI7_9BACI|nr:LuxR family transcriptional regulator [Lederbergia citri]MBS4196464.1 helix-turn-helix domain-containing protein [Lederbergia citri]